MSDNTISTIDLLQYIENRGQTCKTNNNNSSGINFDSLIDSASKTMNSAALSDNANFFISENDKDGNGVLSADEMGVSQDVFGKLDTNSDGAVDGSELDAGRTDAGIIQLMIQNMLATNGNDDICASEGTNSTDTSSSSASSLVSKAYTYLDSSTYSNALDPTSLLEVIA